MKQLAHEIWEFLVKNAVLISSMGIAAALNVAFQSIKRKLSGKEAFFIGALCLFAGWVAFNICVWRKLDPQLLGVIPPFVTFVGDKIMIAIMQQTDPSVKGIMKGISDRFKKDK